LEVSNRPDGGAVVAMTFRVTADDFPRLAQT
jgi:hypothetical protein